MFKFLRGKRSSIVSGFSRENENEEEKFKARLVPKGYSQLKGIEYDQIFSPIVRHTSIREVLTLVVSRDKHLEKINVKKTFLHGNLDENIHMDKSEGFSDTRHGILVYKFNMYLYGLKQSSRQWYKRFNSYMFQIEYKICEYKCCVYVRILDDGSFIFLLLYVNYMFIFANNLLYVDDMLIFYDIEIFILPLSI